MSSPGIDTVRMINPEPFGVTVRVMDDDSGRAHPIGHVDAGKHKDLPVTNESDRSTFTVYINADDGGKASCPQDFTYDNVAGGTAKFTVGPTKDKPTLTYNGLVTT